MQYGRRDVNMSFYIIQPRPAIYKYKRTLSNYNCKKSVL